MSTRLVLATHNPHKLHELRQILAGSLSQPQVQSIGSLAQFPTHQAPVEDGISFSGNALLKARAACQATGLPAIADDSGLTVDILGGAPGIFSARWAGGHGDDQANLALLLAQLADVPAQHRGAGFSCALALVTPSGQELVTHGEVRGQLAQSPQGSGGFGYDPILLVEGRSLAEFTPEEKHAVSHRGTAVRAMAPQLAQLLADVSGS